MRWISDDGVAEVIFGSGDTPRVIVPGGVRRLELRIFPRHTEQARAWIGCMQAGDDRHAITVVQDRDEMLVRHTWMRPWADGGEADPRRDSAEWRCARVIEEERAKK